MVKEAGLLGNAGLLCSHLHYNPGPRGDSLAGHAIRALNWWCGQLGMIARATSLMKSGYRRTGVLFSHYSRYPNDDKQG
jgi:hypothetical protein